MKPTSMIPVPGIFYVYEYAKLIVFTTKKTVGTSSVHQIQSCGLIIFPRTFFPGSRGLRVGVRLK